MPGVSQGSTALGDFDNDGDLDILLTGLSGPISKVYRNNGNNTYTDIDAGLQGVHDSSVAWGDYDNDGDLDILLIGRTSDLIGVSKIYRNDGNGIFTEIHADLPGLIYSSADWGDYDIDGDLDILMTGYQPNIKISRIYKNDGNGVFTDINAGISDGRTWGDYDNDGDLDVLAESAIYRNDGNGIFTDINAGVIGGWAWGDYDNDSDLDIFAVVNSGSSYFAKIYRNDGYGIFAEISVGLIIGRILSAEWGDFDNDGDLDILVAGTGGSQIFRNNGNQTFTNINTGLISGINGSANWGDLDNDGDLDVLLTGSYYFYSDLRSYIYRNNSTTSNLPPSAPQNLTVQINRGSITLTWAASTDDHTPVLNLTNLSM